MDDFNLILYLFSAGGLIVSTLYFFALKKINKLKKQIKSNSSFTPFSDKADQGFLFNSGDKELITTITQRYNSMLNIKFEAINYTKKLKQEKSWMTDDRSATGLQELRNEFLNNLNKIDAKQL